MYDVWKAVLSYFIWNQNRKDIKSEKETIFFCTKMFYWCEIWLSDDYDDANDFWVC